MSLDAAGDRSFNVIVHGTVESAECTTAGTIYCQSTLVKGRDWQLVLQGGDRANTVDVVTQMSERQPGPKAKYTWNAPFEFVLQASSPAGWPQMVLSVYNVGGDGKDVIHGYARCHVPRRPGQHTLDLPLMEPVYQTDQHKLFGFLHKKPELRDAAFLASSEDRIVLKCRSVPGYVRVTFNVGIQGLAAMGIY